MYEGKHPVKIVVAFLLVAIFGCTKEYTGDPIVVRDAWIREPPPRSPAAGYLVIENRGGEPVALIAVATEAAEQTEIHVMEYKDDRMTMRRVSELQVPAGEEVALKPGGTHLMLMELRQPLRDGDEIELVLRFGDGTERRTQVPVQKKGLYESE
ncbi:MAG: copper chaperone PCu(A)C [Gemmatimonadetes bacterium]|nr:copper chaperone PCu(A)C [Gemmatimonadota bacterium]MYC73899.1 copper chaperone PCu(A)C [Gemmatimonadota bacterium]MYI63244.1 copper chaperone PCu(A)C [Gemmatimonadota bacterium]